MSEVTVRDVVVLVSWEVPSVVITERVSESNAYEVRNWRRHCNR